MACANSSFSAKIYDSDSFKEDATYKQHYRHKEDQLIGSEYGYNHFFMIDNVRYVTQILNECKREFPEEFREFEEYNHTPNTSILHDEEVGAGKGGRSC